MMGWPSWIADVNENKRGKNGLKGSLIALVQKTGRKLSRFKTSNNSDLEMASAYRPYIALNARST